MSGNILSFLNHSIQRPESFGLIQKQTSQWDATPSNYQGFKSPGNERPGCRNAATAVPRPCVRLSCCQSTSRIESSHRAWSFPSPSPPLCELAFAPQQKASGERAPGPARWGIRDSGEQLPACLGVPSSARAAGSAGSGQD